MDTLKDPPSMNHLGILMFTEFKNTTIPNNHTNAIVWWLTFQCIFYILKLAFVHVYFCQVRTFILSSLPIPHSLGKNFHSLSLSLSIPHSLGKNFHSLSLSLPIPHSVGMFIFYPLSLSLSLSLSLCLSHTDTQTYTHIPTNTHTAKMNTPQYSFTQSVQSATWNKPSSHTATTAQPNPNHTRVSCHSNQTVSTSPNYLKVFCLLEMFFDWDVREFLPLPAEDALFTEELVTSDDRRRTFSWMELRMLSTSPKYGRRTGSPCQQFCINCQHASENVGRRSGLRPAMKEEHLVDVKGRTVQKQQNLQILTMQVLYESKAHIRFSIHHVCVLQFHKCMYAETEGETETGVDSSILVPTLFVSVLIWLSSNPTTQPLPP